jgi:hypothetical protein
MTHALTVACSAVCLALVMPAHAPQDHQHPGGPSEKLGTVHFETSCTPAAQPTFDRAVSLLHSFEFGAAITAFEATLQQDPSCAITEWGIALSRWMNPFAVGLRTPEQLKSGMEAVERGRAIGPETDRERAYLEAVAQLYERRERPQRERIESYRDAMGELSKRYPSDTEAAIFYALSLTAAEDLNDKTYAGRLQAVAILEPLFKQQPTHPGLAHYIIHSYDVPALAPRALDAARRYAEIAPSAPHALHMPSHTFTRVGMWQESIDTNIASAAAAREQHVTSEELHASDYQMYAYLQTGQDAAAKRLLDSLPGMMSRFGSQSVASAAPPAAAYYAMAAIPARWALERGAWDDARTLQIRPTDLPYAAAVTAYARAIGGARAGDLTTARAALALLDELRTRQASMNEPYWTEQIRIQQQGAAAWIAFTEGRQAEGMAAMRAAADAEDRTEKAAITPGPLAPAREQLGEMLLATNDPRGALKEFEATLVNEPNRFRTLYGAAHAARLSGDESAARKYYGKLVQVCARADVPGRRELQEARGALSR